MRSILILGGLLSAAGHAEATQLTISNNCPNDMSLSVATYVDDDTTGIAPILTGPQLQTTGLRTLAMGTETTFTVGAQTYLNAEKLAPSPFSLILSNIGSEHHQLCRLNFDSPDNQNAVSYLSKRSVVPDATGRYAHAYTRQMFIDGAYHMGPTEGYDAGMNACVFGGFWAPAPFIRVPLETLIDQNGAARVQLCRPAFQ